MHILRADGVPIRMMDPVPKGYISEWSKHFSTEPHRAGLVWHTHNTTNVDRWLLSQQDQERLHGVPSTMVTLSRRAATNAERSFARCVFHRGQQRVD